MPRGFPKSRQRPFHPCPHCKESIWKGHWRTSKICPECGVALTGSPSSAAPSAPSLQTVHADSEISDADFANIKIIKELNNRIGASNVAKLATAIG